MPDQRSRIVRASVNRIAHGSRIAVVPLDCSQPDQRLHSPEGVVAVLGMGRAEIAADLEGLTEKRQALVDTPKVHICLTEIVEVIGEKSTILIGLVCLGNGQLLFGHRLFECGERLGVFPRFVVQNSKIIPAQPELAVITGLFGLREPRP